MNGLIRNVIRPAAHFYKVYKNTMGPICCYRTNPVSISTDKLSLFCKLLFNCVITKLKSK